jgi:hypothetical protein
MSITTLFESITGDDPFYFHKEVSRIQPSKDPESPNRESFLFLLESNIVRSSPQNKNHPFISDDIKVFIPLIPGFYHFFYDSLGAFVKQYKKTPKATFVFDTSKLEDSDRESLKFLESVLKNKSIKFLIIDSSEQKEIYANNFYSMKAIVGDTNNAANSVLDFFIDEIDNKEVMPSKKVYLSRSGIKSRVYDSFIVDGTSHKNDTRVYEEKILEDFFREKGFDIIVPERDFKSIKDQLNYFYQVKVLVSPTGGGITNAMFMQPNGKVIEIITSKVNPLEMYEKTNTGKTQVQEVLHHYYVSLCWNKEHTYIGISNKDRMPDTIINKIENVLV